MCSNAAFVVVAVLAGGLLNNAAVCEYVYGGIVYPNPLKKKAGHMTFSKIFARRRPEEKMAVAAFASIAQQAHSATLHRWGRIGDNNELDVGVSKLFKATAAFVKTESQRVYR